MRTEADGGVRDRVMRARIAAVGAIGVLCASWGYSMAMAPVEWLRVPALQTAAVALAAWLVLGAASRDSAPGYGPWVALLAASTWIGGWAWVARATVVPPWATAWVGHFPSPLLAAATAALAGASFMRARVPRLAIPLNLLAGALFLFSCIGHLFDVDLLVRTPGASATAPVASFLMLVLTVAALGLYEGGPVSAYFGTDPGSATRRRLLPAAILIPVGSGFLLVFALESQRFSPTLAVALTVFANVLVMLWLVNAAGNRVTRVVWDRQRRMEAREARVRKQGMRDSLTQLLNRRGWDAEVDGAEKTCRRDGLNACVLVVDLDGLKQINDTRGHKEGDAYIRRAAMALRKAARRGEPLARLGGDEFAYLVVDCDEDAAVEIVHRFEAALRAGRISASVGYAMRGDGTLAQAFELADAEMYREKRARKRRRA